MGNVFRWLYRGLIKDIIKEHPSLKVEYRHWSSREMIEDPKAIVIGHSFGAAAANRNTIKAALLVTLDCRDGFSTKYKSKADCLHLNFWQRWPLRGYPIAGAFDVECFKCGHLGIVKDKTMHNFVLGNIADLMGKN